MPTINVTPSVQKDQLFTLIKSLSKAEKRNFKLYANRNQSNSAVKFIQLFDILDKAEEYKDEHIKKKIRGLNSSQLANLKRHLYKQLLISLRLIHISKNIDIEIREQIDFARILYGKGLYIQSLKILDRIKQIAFAKHQDLLYLEIIEFEKLIEERHITRSRKVANKVESLIQGSATRSAIIHNTCKLSNLKIEIHGFYIRYGHVKNEKDVFVIKELFKSQLAKIDTKKLTFFEKIFLYQSYVWYYYILLDFKNCYRYAAKWVTLFDKSPKMKEDDPDLYMRGMHYLLTSLFNMGQYEKFKPYLQQFEDFGTSYDGILNANSKTIAFLYIYTAKLNFHYLEGSFGESLKLIPIINDKLKTYQRYLDPHRILVINYKIAFLQFAHGDLNAATDFLLTILNQKVGYLREDIQCYARLLQIMCHFEMGDHEFLDYLITSTQRFIQKMNELDKLQLTILRFFRSIIKKLPSEHHAAYIDFRDELKELSKDKFEKRAFLYLDVLCWVESKINGTDIRTAIRERYKVGK